jgi:hypothetical protein
VLASLKKGGRAGARSKRNDKRDGCDTTGPVAEAVLSLKEWYGIGWRLTLQ